MLYTVHRVYLYTKLPPSSLLPIALCSAPQLTTEDFRQAFLFFSLPTAARRLYLPPPYVLKGENT